MVRIIYLIFATLPLIIGSALAQDDEKSLPTGMRSDPKEASMKLERTDERGKTYFLYVHGKRTQLAMTTGLDASPPQVAAGRLTDGTLYGTVSRVESGAYLMSESAVFFKHGKSFMEEDEYEVGERKGDRLLLLHVQKGPWTEKGKAFLYENGKLSDIGFTTDAFLKNDGTIAGFYDSNEDKIPFAGLVSETQAPVYKQYFEFRNGVRTLKGRKKLE